MMHGVFLLTIAWTAVVHFATRFGIYLAAAGLASVAVASIRSLQGWKIQGSSPSRHANLRAVALSARTYSIWAGLGLGTAWLVRSGLTRLYWHVADYGWAYAVFSVVLLVVLQDAYFYWTHRLLHHPRLYKRFHATHHAFTTPSPWTSFAMHPVDAVVQNLFFVVFVVAVPIHPVALAIGAMILTLGVVNLHLGYELMPRRLHATKVVRWLSTSTHHNLHHLRFDGNYGASLRFWDRVMGTEVEDYEASFVDVKAGRRIQRRAKHQSGGQS